MIRLPVSIGEALDKLTILDIKVQKIKNPEKNAYCKQEYDLLYKDLASYVEKNAFYYKRLRDVNLQIWEMQDDIRERPDPQKCVEILDKNDMRFRIKDMINQSVESYIREQKGYPPRRALVIGHMGIGDHIGMIGAVRYISMQHDETVVVCKRMYAGNLASFFADNPSIKLWPVDVAYTTPPTADSAGEIVPVDPEKFVSVYRSGYYKHPNHGFDSLPNCFYLDMGLDPEIRHTHFHVPTTPAAQALYDKVKDIPYVFVQQRSSTQMTPLVTWDIDEILTIDPNLNVYPVDHKWHDLAQTFVNKDFLDYTLLIQNAKEIHTVDSSFYCLACYLPLKAEVKRCYARETGAFISTYTFN